MRICKGITEFDKNRRKFVWIFRAVLVLWILVGIVQMGVGNVNTCKIENANICSGSVCNIEDAL